jgi:hypothetical protein
MTVKGKRHCGHPATTLTAAAPRNTNSPVRCSLRPPVAVMLRYRFPAFVFRLKT